LKFTTHKMIQFSHCDPAGIVFYPQFFYILHYINKLRTGWPMVRLETDFKRPSRYGDQIDVDIEVFKLGSTSLGLEYTIRGDDGERLVANSVIVLTNLDTGKPLPIPDDLRAALTPYLKQD